MVLCTRRFAFAVFFVLCLTVMETTPLCCHLPYMHALPCDFQYKSVSELRSLEPTDEGREVGMPSSSDIIANMIMGLCYYGLCSPGCIKTNWQVFCSTGSCNMFGCNCDGECINDKYVDDHLKRLRQQSNNTKLTYELFSRAGRSIKPRNKKLDIIDVVDTKSHRPTTHSQSSNTATPDGSH